MVSFNSPKPVLVLRIAALWKGYVTYRVVQKIFLKIICLNGYVDSNETHSVVRNMSK
jgi:hypothetical protein